MTRARLSATDGLFRRNAVLSQGMVIAPIVVCCDTLPKALMLALAFALITGVTVLAGAFYPKRFPYAVRIMLYALTAAVVWIPVSLLCSRINPEVYAALETAKFPGTDIYGNTFFYLPLLTVNSFIVLHSELYFYRLRRGAMAVALFSHIAGFALTAATVGLLRELMAHGSIMGYAVSIPVLQKGLASPWGGFLILGALCALHRGITAHRQEAS